MPIINTNGGNHYHVRAIFKLICVIVLENLPCYPALHVNDQLTRDAQLAQPPYGATRILARIAMIRTMLAGK